MKKTFRTNPPWADKILGKHWDAIQRKIGEKFMPLGKTKHGDEVQAKITHAEWLLGEKRVAATTARGRGDAEHAEFLSKQIPGLEASLKRLQKIAAKAPKGFQEFGCGHYGCVMPTGTPGTVFKITTDATEAAFIAAYLSWPKHQRPNGIVGYHRLLAIKSESRLNRPVFVLLRDEAQHIGSYAIESWIRSEKKDSDREYYSRSFRNVTRAIKNSLDSAREVRRLVLKKPNAEEILKQAMERRDQAWEMGPRAAHGRDTILKIAFQLQRFGENAMEMENEPMGVEVGRALRECLDDHGLLLADVHTNNIGMPGTPALLDEIGHTPIITDPGHAITLDDRYKGITVEEV